MRILRTLEGRPMGFAELKREVSIESSGHLQFHLGKLAGLVETTSDGSYTLTDDGREAIRVLKSTAVGSDEIHSKVRSSSLRRVSWSKPLIAGLLIAMVVLGGVAAYQQQQIAALNRDLSADTVMIGGTRYHYETVSPNVPNGTSLTFQGVTFTFLQEPFNNYVNPENYTFSGSVRLSNGTLLDLTGKTVALVGLVSAIQGLVGEIHIPPSDNATTVGLELPLTTEIYLTLPDGTHETYNKPTITAEHLSAYEQIPRPVTLLNYTYPISLANPWFGQHNDPQVGVYWTHSDTGVTPNYLPLAALFVTLYVSASG